MTEGQLRRQLRARAWDFLAGLPADFDPGGGIEESLYDATIEFHLALRRVTPGPPPDLILSLEPLQRWLPGMGLSDMERHVIDYLIAVGTRRTQPEITAAMEEVTGEPVSDGTIKPILARLTAEEVGILSNDRSAHPRGYQVTETYLRFREWGEKVRKLGSLSIHRAGVA